MGGGAIAPPQMIYIVRFVYAGCGVNALSGLQSRINSMYCSLLVDTVMACKFFPGPVSGLQACQTLRRQALFFIPSAIFTPLPDYAVTH